MSLSKNRLQQINDKQPVSGNITSYLVVENDTGLTAEQGEILAKAAAQARSRTIDIDIVFAGVDEAANRRS
jgi:hypothetical protein